MGIPPCQSTIQQDVCSKLCLRIHMTVADTIHRLHLHKPSCQTYNSFSPTKFARLAVEKILVTEGTEVARDLHLFRDGLVDGDEDECDNLSYEEAGVSEEETSDDESKEEPLDDDSDDGYMVDNGVTSAVGAGLSRIDGPSTSDGATEVDGKSKSNYDEHNSSLRLLRGNGVGEECSDWYFNVERYDGNDGRGRTLFLAVNILHDDDDDSDPNDDERKLPEKSLDVSEESEENKNREVDGKMAARSKDESFDEPDAIEE
nr:hypothetical protein [Tanacetum cinerariifolium]